MDQQHSKVERFLKLGYPHGEILRVLESLSHDAQTNDILEELIKTCHSSPGSTRSASSSNSSSPQLVPRGCSPPQPYPSSGSCQPPQPSTEPAGGFRPVVIDGSNVAMSHGDKRVFSCRGLQLAVQWFWDRGVRDITAFVPLWRKEQPRAEAPITDQQVLHDLERRRILVYTPSRCVKGKRVVCYDDRYIVKLAHDSDGIIVSNDNYRDLQMEKPEWKTFIEERLLMYSFVNDKFMPPDDPLGRNGPTIDNFLRRKPRAPDTRQQLCPYGKKCTYGLKCKFYHPERTNQSQLSVADELRAMRRPVADREQFLGLPPAQDAEPYSAPTSYHHLEHISHPRRYHSTPPPLRKEEQLHRASPNEPFISSRNTGSPAPPNSSLRLCPSPDSDEAFGSMESSLSRLHIQDTNRSTENLSYAYSSGVAGCSHSSEDIYLSGSYNVVAPRSNGVGHTSAGHFAPQGPPPCSCHQKQGHQYSWPWLPPGSADVVPTTGDCDDHVAFSDRQYFQRPPPNRQSHSLPGYHWGHGGLPGRKLTSIANTPSSEQRRNLRSQLSTLYNQSTVEHFMTLYPHVLELSELLPLIQRYRNNQVSL